jgi:hypothetical protein
MVSAPGPPVQEVVQGNLVAKTAERVAANDQTVVLPVQALIVQEVMVHEEIVQGLIVPAVIVLEAIVLEAIVRKAIVPPPDVPKATASPATVNPSGKAPTSAVRASRKLRATPTADPVKIAARETLIQSSFRQKQVPPLRRIA